MHNIKRLARRLINKIPGEVRGNILYATSMTDNYAHLTKDKKKIIVTLAADYGNLGDVAITLAQCTFLEDNFKEYDVVSLPISRTYRDLRSLKKRIGADDIITMVGGGNMGTLYESIENQRQLIIKKLPQNRIISFPQSIYYGTSERDVSRLNKAIATYSHHPQLTLLSRDDASYIFMKEHFPKNTIDTSPDIVLYMKKDDASVQRDKNQITLSLRQDKESGMTPVQRQALVDELSSPATKIVYRDTDLGEVKLGLEDGIRELETIWHIFKTSGVVITDRLHGMIFCAITKTPCIAINNNNGKVAGAYKKWLSGVSFISMLDSFDLATIKKEQQRLAGIDTRSANYSIDFEKLRAIVADELVKK